MCVISNAIAASMAEREAASRTAARPFTSLSEGEQLAFWRAKLQGVVAAAVGADAAAAAALAPTAAAPAPVPLDTGLVLDLRADVERLSRERDINLTRIRSLEKELYAEKRKALTVVAENAATVAAMEDLWKEENAAKLAAQAEVGQLREELANLREEVAAKASTPSGDLVGFLPEDWATKVQELVTFLGSQEGKEFKAAFAAGDDDAKDLVLALAVKPVTDMVAKVPYGQVELVGRAIDLIGGLVTEALKDRLEEGGEPQPPAQTPPAPAAATPTPSHRDHPLKKGKARRGVVRHGPLEELADMVAEGELRLRRA